MLKILENIFERGSTDDCFRRVSEKCFQGLEKKKLQTIVIFYFYSNQICDLQYATGISKQKLSGKI